LKRNLVSGVSSDKLRISAGWPALSVFHNDKEENMRDVAKEVYEKMKVGSMAWVRPVAAKGDTLPSFQAAHDSAKQLEEEGLITIGEVKRQDDGLIEAIRIQRLA
jgi:hypothetical protein